MELEDGKLTDDEMGEETHIWIGQLLPQKNIF
jgi:hypothetical protein